MWEKTTPAVFGIRLIQRTLLENKEGSALRISLILPLRFSRNVQAIKDNFVIMGKQFLSLFFALGFCACHAQTSLSTKLEEQKIFPLGVVETIHSTVLSEDRVLNIYLPDGYKKDVDSSYPVIYLLDGSANEDFIHIVGLVQFLTMIGAMPNTIVVGIANVDRRRDFTFPTTIGKDKKDYPTTGSSGKFMLFIEKELEPYIIKNYRCNTSKTIIGQSLGGLFATEVLLRKPFLFNNYIIVSPSLWWDNESLLSLAPGLLKLPGDSHIHAYVSVGSAGKQMEDDAKKLVAILQSQPNQKIKVDFVPLPDENHLTILHISVYKALEILNAKK